MNFGNEEMAVMGETVPWLVVKKWGCAVLVG